MPPSRVSDDATFSRRVSIDIAGRLPTATEAEAFLNSTDPKKRDKLIDRLLASTDYADYFANKWSALLRNKRSNASAMRGNFATEIALVPVTTPAVVPSTPLPVQQLPAMPSATI